MVEFNAVLVVGAGLIGTSIGLTLTDQGHQVHLSDATPSHALVAAGLGAGSVERPDSVDLVVVAVPPSAVASVVGEALRRFPQATVTDVASVKQPILEQLQISGADLSRYVGSHPMAGSHRSGPLPARADLFVDSTWVITPHQDAASDRVETIHQLAKVCGAKVVVMEPTEHDEAVASISHVPQIVSSLLAGNLTDVNPAHLRLAGQGVRDVTRIAASDGLMWTQIIVANQTAIRAQLNRLSGVLEELSASLDSPQFVSDFMKHGIEGSKAIPAKRGRSAGSYLYVVVEIPDSPGALARLFADIDAAGVNVEDLAIEHAFDREVGYLSIAVEPDKAESLSQVMTIAGWTLRQ